MADIYELAGNIHMHTPYSDGEGTHAEIAEAAIAAGLDFVIVTDHNIWVDGVEGYYRNQNGRVLLLVGEEVHDMRRDPQVNHCLVLGAEAEMASYGSDPQELIDAVQAAGGYTFLAHPFDPAAPAVGEDQYPWVDWDITGFTGIELWNYMSNFKLALTSYPRAARAIFNPQKFINRPMPETLALWDKLLATGRPLPVVGGADAHGFKIKYGPITREVFPYEFLFRAVNTHIWLREPLSGELEIDKQRILRAVGRGQSWVGYDMPASTAGFRFTAQSLDRGTLGETVRLDAGATLQVRTPQKCDIRIVHQGNVVAQTKQNVSLVHLPIEPGAYRVECYIEYEGAERGWIYSNPIYLVEP